MSPGHLTTQKHDMRAKLLENLVNTVVKYYSHQW